MVGAGTMGAQIAAHMANAGVEVHLLDVDAAAAAAGWKRALALKPDPLFTPAHAALVRTGAIDDAAFGEADWIVEAIVERLEPKRSLFERIDRQRGLDTIVSSNTSGLPLASLVEGRSEAFALHFVGTHFFNPPRYMPLVEVIPVAATSEDTIARARHWLDVRLGRSVVVARDSPNFIANHIGLYGLFKVLQAWEQGPFDIDTIDAMTGPAIGRPKSATFRTIDITGLDVATQVARNFVERTSDAGLQRLFTMGPRIAGLVERGWIGEKAGQGFFKRSRGAGGASDILVLDPATFAYVPRVPVARPVLDALRDQRGGAGGRIKALMLGKAEESAFTRDTLGDTLLYTARVWQTIAHDIDDVDRAMRWGFGWDLGPFEIIDAIGIKELLGVMRAQAPTDGRLGEPALPKAEEAPPLLADALAAGRNTIRTPGAFRPEPAELLILAGARDRQSVVTSNAAASVLDTGDGIFAVELHSKMNAIGGDTLAMLQAGVDRAERDGIGLILATQGQAFSAGANLMLVLMDAQEGEWDSIDAMVRVFQRTVLSFRDAQVPVVNAINGLTLGGATEMALHAAGVQAAAETYMGLVEVGVGLIPAGCGTKEMLWRANQQRPSRQADALPFVQKAFETIGFGMVSTSAPHARTLGYLRNGDGISMNRSRLHADARELVQARAAGYVPGHAPAAIAVGGPDVLAALTLGVHLAHRAGRIGDHDATIGRKLAWILAGGNVPHATDESEAYLLDLEREAFLSLCGEPKTQERIAYTLKTGKTMRN
ncbi:putative 3-hydroxyacyl-CoA dehydrogenase [Luteitalea pratensis]|uniref:Putative 3-hydroxyacyl-CoA dehydrogenase n=1 Tax=Luteitalea pratensis TaxID=1855912 RepID=A0A143PWQ9_LUTPR|nr:putative 3-hydroxyacyl-CoA dehydrogenase [Luteitalea pratensis]